MTHEPKYVEEPGLIDTYQCSCGWQSQPYYDGAEFAYEDWKRHRAAAMATEVSSQNQGPPHE